MRAVRDSFLHFLADNLTPLSVHPIRRDPDNPKAGNVQVNAINVGFGSVSLRVCLSKIIVKIDVIADAELDAIDMTQKTWLLLSSQFYTTLLDYTVPTSPVDMKSKIMWKEGFNFIPVDNDAYYQYSCTLSVQFHNVLPQ